MSEYFEPEKYHLVIGFNTNNQVKKLWFKKLLPIHDPVLKSVAKPSSITWGIKLEDNATPMPMEDETMPPAKATKIF